MFVKQKERKAIAYEVLPFQTALLPAFYPALQWAKSSLAVLGKLKDPCTP